MATAYDRTLAACLKAPLRCLVNENAAVNDKTRKLFTNGGHRNRNFMFIICLF